VPVQNRTDSQHRGNSVSGIVVSAVIGVRRRGEAASGASVSALSDRSSPVTVMIRLEIGTVQ
jgi:hypothetical protein